jgi:hypothetical protein
VNPYERFVSDLAKRDSRYAKYVGQRPRTAPSRAPRETSAVVPPGVGAELQLLIQELTGRSSGAGCGCKALAYEMDEKGADWCWDARYHIVDRLRENVRKERLATKLKAAFRAAIALTWIDPRDPAVGLFDRAYDRYCEKNPEYRSRRWSGPTA